MKRCKVNRWFLAKRGIGNDKVVHPFECIRMPLDFAMLAKRFFCDGQPSRRKNSVSPSENVLPSSAADAHVHSAIRASCKAARLYSGMASKHWKRSDITVHPFVPLKGCLVLMGKSLLRFPARVAEMVCELNLQKKLCVRCGVRTLFLPVDESFWTVWTCPKRTGFRTHAKSVCNERISYATYYFFMNIF